jgi:mannan endo-1,4-beta-mannosidase
MIEWIKLVHTHGGINTISWHMDNPVNGNSSWDKTPIGKDILPGGTYHQAFLDKLDRAASFLKACKIGIKYVPIIFRPYHEHNGDWFWWGKGNLTEEEYRSVFRFTIDYFQDVHQIHHLIYAFSPDRSRISTASDITQYLYGYPGDNYVDIIGLDNYRDVGATGIDTLDQKGIENLKISLEMITDLADQKGKIAALTETGSEGIKDENWFTQRLLQPLLSSEKAQRISYILTWRNANTEHHFMSYPGHPSEEDLSTFVTHPAILTLEDVGRRFSINKIATQ